MFLLSALRFDDVTSREERRSKDCTAIITEEFESFIANCQKKTIVAKNMSQLMKCFVLLEENVSSRIYMKSKPAKYGIKIMCLCDPKTYCLYNSFIYTGKSTSYRRGQVSIPT